LWLLPSPLTFSDPLPAAWTTRFHSRLACRKGEHERLPHPLGTARAPHGRVRPGLVRRANAGPRSRNGRVDSSGENQILRNPGAADPPGELLLLPWCRGKDQGETAAYHAGGRAQGRRVGAGSVAGQAKRELAA